MRKRNKSAFWCNSRDAKRNGLLQGFVNKK
nr:MAG TPA: hypothetical protein [Caudoviricetes sp.]